jgi:hypothetical protein
MRGGKDTRTEVERALVEEREEGLRFLRGWNKALLERVRNVRPMRRADYEYFRVRADESRSDARRGKDVPLRGGK